MKTWPLRGGMPVRMLAALCLVACTPPPRMCVSESECGAQASCVAGRCVAHGATPAIGNARRLVFAPVDAGYVRRGDDVADEVMATLGRGDGGVAFLRFSVPLAPEATVLEAYVALERATDVDADPVPIVLHAERIAGPWDSRSLSWARQPRFEEVGAPITRVSPSSGALVRIDVREIVQRWRRRGRDELGVAVVADGRSATGLAFALAPSDVARGRRDPVLSPEVAPAGQPASPFEPHVAPPSSVGDPRGQLGGPRLELYVR